MMHRPQVPLALLALASLAACVATPDPDAANIARERHAAQDPQAMRHIGDAARAQGDLKTAIAFYGRACALHPHDFAYVTPYAETLAQTGDLGQAMSAIRAARIADDEAQNLTATLLQARLLTMAQRPQDAIGLLNLAIASHPQNVSVLIARGVALDTARDFPGAQASYASALAIDPGNIPAQNNMALSMALGGAPTEGLARLNALRGKAVEQGLPDAQIATIDGNLGIVYALLGDLSDARAAGLGAVQSNAQAQSNARFYSLLSPDVTGAPDKSGLSSPPD